MLIGKSGDEGIEASLALKGAVYICPSPECGGTLILKQGSRVAAHFAHKPPFRCTWAALETAEHRQAKLAFHSAFTARGLKAELEIYAAFPDGSPRRADVMVRSPSGTPIAFEFQKTRIGLTEIEERAKAYARNGHAQVWIPLARPDFWKQAVQTGPRKWRIERYVPGDFEKWISGFYRGKQYWMFDPSNGQVLCVTQKKHALYREGGRHFHEGEEQFSDGYHYNSKRFRTLIVEGPFEVSDFAIRLGNRPAFSAGPYHWPAARLALLQRLENPLKAVAQ